MTPKPIYTQIVIPRHPDDANIPDSIINILLPSGRIATYQGPIYSKTMEMMSVTLMACKDAIVEKPKPDFSI